MVFKLLIIIALASFVGFAEAQYPPWDNGDPIRENDYEMLTPNRCNETVCYAPCEGAAPPPVCPRNIPECSTGCACYMDCSTNVLTCFMTKHCTKITRFMTKHRHARAVSQDVNLSGSTVTQNKSLHVEQDLPNSIVVEAKNQRTEQTIPTHTAAHGISGRAKQDSPASLAAQGINGQTKQDLSASSGTQVSSGRVERDLSASTVSLAVSQSAGNNASTVKPAGRVERELPESTVTQANEKEASSLEHATFSTQQDAITLGKPVDIDDKRLEKEAKIAVELKAEKSVEKAVVASADNEVSVKAKMANAGVEILADAALCSVVLLASFYRCIGS